MSAHVDYSYLNRVMGEINDQPAWRKQADIEMDYYDGNQLDTQTVSELKEKGVPPTIENLIAPTIDDLIGIEENNRTDLRVLPESVEDNEAEEVAEALDRKINEAEKRSGADTACSEAYADQVKVGIGWCEVSRNPDPFSYPYRVERVCRNEIWWDFSSKRPDLSDARWLLRRRWCHIDVACQLFPEKKEIIQQAGKGGLNSIDDLSFFSTDTGGDTTGYVQSDDIERGWSVEEQEWRTPENNRVCLFELLTREFVIKPVLFTPDGRVVEFDINNPFHVLAISRNYRVEKRPISKIHKHFFIGPILLHSEQIEFKRFNYVPFWGKREDRTNVPYGVIRPLIPLQDEINARVRKMYWLLSATRTIRTEGALGMDENYFRQVVGRPDADIILDDDHFRSNPGAQFKIEHNERMNQQQYERLLDLRKVLRQAGGSGDAFAGDASPNNSGAFAQAIDQTIQGFAKMRQNFRASRRQVGDLLLTMIIGDIGSNQEVVEVKGNPLKENKTIILNCPGSEVEGRRLSNDVQRTKLKVDFNEVPSSPTYKAQQLKSMSEAFKAAPPQYQAVMMPHLTNLMDVPDKDVIVEAILEINRQGQLTEEQVEQQVKQAVEQAKKDWMLEQKNRELDIKERKTDAEIKKIINESVNAAIESIYSATQAGLQVMTQPGVAGSADQVLKSAGFEDRDEAPIVAPVNGSIDLLGRRQRPGTQQPEVQQNTSPMFPPRVQVPRSATQVDNKQPAPLPQADVELNKGIEAEGAQ